MAVDTNHEVFSSEPTIVLPDPAEDFTLPMFIAMDPPKHDVQRKTVSPIVAGPNLAKLEPIIRERAGAILDDCPIGEEFDWVDKVSIELTHHDPGDPLRLPVGGPPQADPLVGRGHRRAGPPGFSLPPIPKRPKNSAAPSSSSASTTSCACGTSG